jgi:DNA repair exonuclease SbcCD ATPase subunit
MAKETVQLVLDVDQKKAHESMKAISAEIVDIKKGFEGLKKGSKEYEDQMKKLEAATKRWTESASIGDLTKEMNKLNREIKQLVPGSDAFIQKSKQLSVVRDRFREVNAELKGIQQNANPSKLTQFFSSIVNGIKAITAASVILFAINEIFSFIKGIASATSEMYKLRGETQQLTGETGAALDALTSKTKTLADVFGEDYGKVLRATNTLAKEFNIGTDPKRIFGRRKRIWRVFRHFKGISCPASVSRI